LNRGLFQAKSEIGKLSILKQNITKRLNDNDIRENTILGLRFRD
jgi:hypothetical protein